jgi:hypothetical protein
VRNSGNMMKPDECLRYAEQCLKLVQLSKNDAECEQLIQLAKAWMKAALDQENEPPHIGRHCPPSITKAI